ncbi:MAG TPA: hypothetical protein VH277_07345 [Gemmatimonadaceae bacterium]|jgi:hypothetical protein|nr:hypothetical protein [Gemmatimonadaceae bacterium]
MPQDKDLKRLVRARMEKTGESYTSARAQITAKPRRKRAATTPLSDKTAPDYAKLAGMSDDVVNEKTGCTWERWVKSLDADGADKLPHKEIAQLVNAKYKVGPWWAQMVAVGYERVKGLRARGQQRNGSFGASKSKTFSVPVEMLFDAWADAKTRKRWLGGKSVKIRTATKPKSMRLDWPDGGIVAVGFYAKGAGKSSVALEHTRLPSREAVNEIKAYWAEALTKLGEIL